MIDDEDNIHNKNYIFTFRVKLCNILSNLDCFHP